ncbi:hypothetical protein [Marinitoga litoralis]|uniref:hypothetical protein n=1 Tax=Marinitoga litoralis TaxID=570855 RepID=UPI001960AAEC|nr:hypothetical protein [Marinitoga litoralis]MBM7559903.1 hypothetical protein [Marinitoga litoralis]
MDYYAGDRMFYSSGSIKNGVLYIGGGHTNYLYAIYVSSTTLAETSWPKYMDDIENSGNFDY